MKWLQVVFGVLSSAGVLSDLLAIKQFKGEANRLKKELREQESEILSKIEANMQQVYQEMTSLRIVVKFLLIACLILFVLQVSLIIFIAVAIF